jgi:hypothetical protein
VESRRRHERTFLGETFRSCNNGAGADLPDSVNKMGGSSHFVGQRDCGCRHIGHSVGPPPGSVISLVTVKPNRS